MAQQQTTSNTGDERAARLAKHTGEDSCQLTTYDRATGLVHEVPVRYAVHLGNIFLLSDEGGDAAWVKNLVINPEVSVRIGGDTIAGMARVVINSAKEEELARRLLAGKYEGWREGQSLSQWARDALPVVIETQF